MENSNIGIFGKCVIFIMSIHDKVRDYIANMKELRRTQINNKTIKHITTNNNCSDKKQEINVKHVKIKHVVVKK